MKDVKYRMEALCIYDYRGVEEHLSAMAAKGWRLEKPGNTLWKYRRAEPAKVRYAVTYSAGASQFNPGPTQGQQSLEELCAAAGWEKACDWFQMQIFCTQDETAVPLETDEAIRLENIHRAMRKNLLPSSVVLLLLSLLMSAPFLYSLFFSPLRLLQSNSRLLTASMYLLMMTLEVYTLCHYYGWRRRSRAAIAEGGTCAPIGRGYRRLNFAGLALVGVLSVLYLLAELFSGHQNSVLLFIIYIALLIPIIFLIRRTTVLLRNRGVSKGWNIAGTLAADVVLVCVLTGGLTFGIIRFGWFTGGSNETYIYNHMEWDVHPREDVPLTLSQLTGEPYGHISRTWRGEGSVFLPVWDYWERVYSEQEEHHDFLSYTIYEPRGQWLRDALMEDLLSIDGLPGMERAYLADDAASWGAEAVYRRYISGTPVDRWLICWPGRVVELSLDGALTEREKGLIQSHLS